MNSWAAPQDSEVERTLSAVGEPALRRLFFQGLQNPEWLAPLTKLGVFADPGVSDTDDGRTAWPWPEGDYLRSVAADRPAEVAAVLARLTDSANPWVIRTLVDTAATLPVEHLNQLVPGIAKLVEQGASRVDPRKVASIVELLMDANEQKKARKLLNSLFKPSRGPEEVMAFGTRSRVSASMGDYWYKELLLQLSPRIVAQGMDGLKLAVGWLIAAIEIRANGESERFYGIWRPSIALHTQNSGLDEIDDALIDLTRDVGVAVTLASESREAIDFLNSRNSFTARRIAAEIAASVGDSGVDNLRTVGKEMLCDPSLLDTDARPEYAHLANVLARCLTHAELDRWTNFLLDGEWLPDVDLLRRTAARRANDPSAVSDQEIDRERRRLTHRLLSAFSTTLTGRLLETFVSLEQEFGTVPHPEFTVYMESFAEPPSPLTSAELSAMSAEEIADFLATWAPDSSDHYHHSVEQLGRILEGVVTAKPAHFEGICAFLAGFEPSYVRSIIDGWAKAIPTGYRPTRDAWDTLAQLATPKPNVTTPNDETEVDLDSRWQPVHYSLVKLAVAVADNDQNIDQLDAAWRVLQPLMTHVDSIPDAEANFSVSNTDPLTVSLNTIRPEAIRGALHVLSALPNEIGDQATRLLSEILGALVPHVGPSGDPSLAVAAVFGEGLGRIWGADEGWVTERLDTLVGSVISPTSADRAWADVVVSIALRVYRPSAPVLRMLRPAIVAVLSPEYASGDHIDGWRTQRSVIQNVATHVLWSAALGLIELDDPLYKALFGGSVDADNLADAIGHHGWQLMRSLRADEGPPPPDFLERSRRIVEQRITAARSGTGSLIELREFHWWVKSSVFEIEWWLPILAEITAGGVVIDKTFIGEPLERASAVDPLETVRVFERLISGGEYWQRFDLMQHAANIVRTALDSPNAEAVALAQSLRDRFAREGHFDVIDQIDRMSNETPG
jgi:hypothetical protein